MYRIVTKKKLNPTVCMMEIEAPFVAKKAEPGQFIILRVDENGERIPLTVAGFNREKGTVKIIFQIVGATTLKLNALNEGDFVQDFAGPLGVATRVEGLRKALIIGGGVGCAIALPIAEKLAANGCEVTSVIGFRNKELLILEDEFKAASKKLFVMTDDGSYGEQGNVCVPVSRMLSEGGTSDLVSPFLAFVSGIYVIVVVQSQVIVPDGAGIDKGVHTLLPHIYLPEHIGVSAELIGQEILQERFQIQMSAITQRRVRIVLAEQAVFHFVEV